MCKHDLFCLCRGVSLWTTTDPWLLDWNDKNIYTGSWILKTKCLHIYFRSWVLSCSLSLLQTNSLSSGAKWFPTSMSTFFFPSLTSCSLMVGATSSEFRPVLSLGWLTVKWRVHPRLINSCWCASASWLTTLLSTCITTNNFCMRIIQIIANI